MHIEVQGVEINDSSQGRSETFSGDLIMKFQKFENIHQLSLKPAVEAGDTLPPPTS